MCIGIGTGFPTFAALKLREMFHTENYDIPPIFLIEEAW